MKSHVDSCFSLDFYKKIVSQLRVAAGELQGSDLRAATSANGGLWLVRSDARAEVAALLQSTSTGSSSWQSRELGSYNHHNQICEYYLVSGDQILLWHHYDLIYTEMMTLEFMTLELLAKVIWIIDYNALQKESWQNISESIQVLGSDWVKY